MITKAELKYMQDLCDKATPAPWSYDGMHDEIHCHAEGHDYFLVISALREFNHERTYDEYGHSYNVDFEFMAESRQMVPRMLAYIKALENKVEYLEGAKA